ncbi:MAG: S-layer homology domain-containing protein [Clostridiales bacterium]|jgi:DNA-binding beta-propeller fold protein YncE|nr:S-layer homology domain-containing protein [Clostridiales bacterium]
MKRITAIFVLAVLVAAGALTAFAQEARPDLSNFARTATFGGAFTDIEGHWAANYITNAYEFGIVAGMGGGIFSPDSYFTVSQAIIVAARLHMVYTQGQLVADLGGEIAYAREVGLIGDEWDGMMDNPATRAQAVGILSRVLTSRDMARVNTVNSLPDVNIFTDFAAEIVLFYEAGIVVGSDEGMFNPYGNFRRSEAAAIFMRMINTQNRIAGLTFGEQSVANFAGTGSSGFSNGILSAASFTLPHGLAISPDGALLVFDTFNNAIRTIDGNQVATKAGIWIETDETRFSRGMFLDGSLAEALFNRPTDGVFNAAGELFVLDSQNHKIRLISGGNVTTFVDEGILNTPMAIAIDGAGNLYVADTLNEVIRKVDIAGNVSIIAGVAETYGHLDGPAATALFRQPAGIAVSYDGNTIFVADTGNHQIRKIENGIVTTLAGANIYIEDGEPLGGHADGSANAAMFNLPRGLAFCEANNLLFVADTGNNIIRAVNMQGGVFTIAGTGEPGDAEGGGLTAEFSQPAGLTLHDGILYIADTANNQIKRKIVDINLIEEVQP